MANSLGEGFVRITYTGETVVHHQMLPVNFDGDPVQGSEPDFTTKSGGSVGAIAAVSNFLAVWQPFFENTTIFGLTEVYAVDPDTEERSFIYGFDAGGIGVSGGGNVPLSMAVFTLKTSKGGVLKLYAMEGVLVPNNKLLPPYTPSGNEDDLFSFLCGASGWVVGRDDAYPFAPISITTKYSDALRESAGL